MPFEEREALRVRGVARLHELRVPANLANRHPGGAKPREKRDELEVGLSVAAMAASVAAHGFEQPRPLVVAKRVRAQPGGFGCLGDAQFALRGFGDGGHAFTIGLRVRSKSRFPSSLSLRPTLRVETVELHCVRSETDVSTLTFLARPAVALIPPAWSSSTAAAKCTRRAGSSRRCRCP